MVTQMAKEQDDAETVVISELEAEAIFDETR